MDGFPSTEQETVDNSVVCASRSRRGDLKLTHYEEVTNIGVMVMLMGPVCSRREQNNTMCLEGCVVIRCSVGNKSQRGRLCLPL